MKINKTTVYRISHNKSFFTGMLSFVLSLSTAPRCHFKRRCLIIKEQMTQLETLSCSTELRAVHWTPRPVGSVDVDSFPVGLTISFPFGIPTFNSKYYAKLFVTFKDLIFLAFTSSQWSTVIGRLDLEDTGKVSSNF